MLKNFRVKRRPGSTGSISTPLATRHTLPILVKLSTALLIESVWLLQKKLLGTEKYTLYE